MRNDKGISLLQVLISIIIIIMISSFAILYSSHTSTEAKLARLYSEMSAVKDAYKNALMLNELNPDEYSLETLFPDKVTNEWISDNYARIGFSSKPSEAIGWYLITPENAENIELEKVQGTYVIDNTNDLIYLLDGFSREGQEETVYEYEDILKLYKGTIK